MQKGKLAFLLHFRVPSTLGEAKDTKSREQNKETRSFFAETE